MSCSYIKDMTSSGLLSKQCCFCNEYAKKFGTNKVNPSYSKEFCISNNHRNKSKCPLFV